MTYTTEQLEAMLTGARDAALVEAAGTLEVQALDADAQAKRFRGGSDPWADRTTRSRALRNSAAAILALRDKPAPAATVEDSFSTLVAEARAEAEKAMKKFPQPNYVLLKVAKEAGEVVKAGVHFAEGRETRENVRSEMIQAIAMLYRLWVEGDQVNGVPPIAGGGDE